MPALSECRFFCIWAVIFFYIISNSYIHFMASYKIVLIGAGNVATHLGKALKKSGHQIVQVFSKSLHNAETLGLLLHAPFTNKLSDINKSADVYLLAVKDYAIDECISGLRLPGKIVAHTSGAVPLTGMERISVKCGVIYPLQTMTKNVAVDLSSVPFFVEASDKQTESVLLDLAGSISKLTHTINSNQRKALHLAAVYVNNFSNHLFYIARCILKKEQLPFELLYPLIKETVVKVGQNDPFDIQTGPARRNDFKTIDEHLHYLESYPEFREVYLVMTESIMAAYNKK
jgi:predicted short-subunit dehydrogenase-like oxidoreductase (DUF2520 family)